MAKSWFDDHPHIRAAIASKQGKRLIWVVVGVGVFLIGVAVFGADPILERLDKIATWVESWLSPNDILTGGTIQ